MTSLLRFTTAAAILHVSAFTGSGAATRPYIDGEFKGRIAYSADGNHNDPDDWIASPVVLAILAQAGLKDRLVHFDYNSILLLTHADWEAVNTESVLGAAKRHGYDTSRFFDDRRDLDGAIASIVRAVNASSAGDPLYFIIAGPMEVAVRALRQSDPAKLRYVTCISHSRWNDGYQNGYTFSFTKRSVIELGVVWVQIPDQNRLLSFGRFGRPSPPEEFAPYFWMRDSRDANIRFLWDRMVVSTRPDPSDAGMAWFLVTGDEECDPGKLERFLEKREPAARVSIRPHIRLEAENFRHLEGLVVEDRSPDRATSHRLAVQLEGASKGRIRTLFQEPFAVAAGRYDVEIRYWDERGATCGYALFVNGNARGTPWKSPGEGGGWTSHVIQAVDIKLGDEIRIDVGGSVGRVDYIQLNVRIPSGTETAATSPARLIVPAARANP
jgi:hypothetical protein